MLYLKGKDIHPGEPEDFGVVDTVVDNAGSGYFRK